jgi:malonyl-CoA O-methyltransferase
MLLLNSIKRRLSAIDLISRIRSRELETKKVDAREGYRLWAPTYAEETATSFLDDELARTMLHGLAHAHLLDAGCGIGRRIKNISGAIGLDQSPEMLAAGVAENVRVGDVKAMPFPSGCFDMIWCRLVLGHLLDVLPAYREFARVCTKGGYVFVTDFHPDAARAGHRRTFSVAGTVHEVEHYVHIDHVQLAAETGLTLVNSSEGVVGPSIQEFYARGIGLRAYKRDIGLKLVSAFLFRRSDCKPSVGSTQSATN